MVDRLLRMWRTLGAGRTDAAPSFENFSFEASTAVRQVDSAFETAGRVSTLDLAAPPPHRLVRERVPASWVAAFAAMLIVYLATCGVPRLFDQIDGQYAGAAREMMVRGDWLTPTQNGVPRLQKPPLVYWCELLSLGVFGVNEFAARFPVVLATVGWFFATGLIAWRSVGTRSAGLAAGLALAMCTGTFFFTHLVMPEPFLGCFMALSFWSLLGAIDVRPERAAAVDRWLIAAWLFMALGALAKGIHALVIPVVAMSCAAWITPSIRTVWRRFLLRPHGWIVCLVIVVPWYLVMESRYPGFLKDHFFNEQIGSALSRRWPPDSDRVPLWIFWLEHLVLFFPITLLFPAAIQAAFDAHKDGRLPLKGGALLLLFWFLVNGLGISFANVQDYYLMIAWPPVAVWIAWAITKHRISFKWPAMLLSLLGIAGLTVAYLLSIWRMPETGESATSDEIIGDTISNVFQILSASLWTDLTTLLYLASAAALLTGILVWLFNRKRRSDLAFAGFAFFMAGMFLVSTRGLAIVQDEFSSAKLARIIDSWARPGSTVICQGDPNENTTLFFYVKRPICWVDGHPDMEFATRILGIGRDQFLTHEQVAKIWRGGRQVFLVVERDALADWNAYLGLEQNQSVPIGTCGSRVVLLNRGMSRWAPAK
jgi:4-amino-4-deoxy-L-arabinose transferase-like glycosyltransferase